ncbi:MAG: AsmA-like C-terminal region-containing protein, partial [Pseudomonadota bacterium]
QVVGALEAVGSLLALPPVSLFAATDLDPESFATGQAEARVGLEFRFQRAVPRDEIAFSATGTLREVRAEGLLPGRTLTAEALDLTVTPEVVALAGRGAIDGVPFTGRWSQVLGADADGSSRAEARVALNAATLARFGVDLPPGSVSGSGGADVAVTLPPDGPASISIRSDLAGLGLAVPSLGWRLSQPATGDLAAVVTLGPQLAIPELRLEAAGLAIDASVAFDPGGGAQVALASARVGSWADIRGAVRVPAGGAAPSLRLEGGRIDLTALPGGGPGGGSGGGGQGMAITGRLDRVTLADGIDLTGVTADLDPRLAGTFAASVNGAASLSGEIRPTDGRLAVQISAPDAGAVLRAAGLFENAYGGALVLTLTPAGPPGSFTGRLDIDGARLRDAPAMAELLNAISVVGLLEQLTAEGINLGEIEAQFRIVPGAIVLDQGTAVGPSLGLSLDGVYDTATGSYDMQGVISPFYFVNGAFGAIFAQRREGLVGVTYRIIGSPEGAEVRVNPLSILTPGIFREIFRRPPPQVIQSE